LSTEYVEREFSDISGWLPWKCRLYSL